MVLQIARAGGREGWVRAIADRPWRTILSALLIASLLGPALRLVPERAGMVLGIVFGLSVLVVLVGWATLYAVLTCVSLYRSYRDSGVEARNQVRWPLWGTLTALGSSILLMLFAIVLGYVWADAGPITYAIASGTAVVTKLVYILIPISFAFAIVKYRLLDIDIVIRKTVVYSTITGIVLALYLAIAGISGLLLVRTAGLQGETATIAATLAVVALFVPIRNRVQAFVDRRFFQRERDLEAARDEINRLVFATTDADDVMPRIAEATQQALHCRSVVVFTRSGESLRPSASVGLPDERVRAVTVPVTSPLLTGDERVVRFDRGAAPEALRSIRPAMLAPARRVGEAVGMLSAGPRIDGGPFDNDDEAFLSAVADQLMLALGRSDQSRSLAELQRAREIQRSLLPETLPQIDGVEITARWQPAREVSGDYYDVLRLADDRVALCVGDVVGKGMPAALLMSSLQAALKAVAYRVGSPKEICSQVRDVMLQSLTGGTFVTFFLCIVDRGAGRLTYCNAGHNPPLLVRADGTLVALDVGGPILARIAAEIPYQEASVNIAPGDRLVLYTDGVTEAMDADEEMFEEERLQALVLEHRRDSAPELERVIADTVLAHADGVLQDDLTLVVAAVE
jgi:sigma-B regulation protein RsbU (phosphoserine phosphatase)